MKTILVATDLSARGDRAVHRGAQLAKLTGAALQIVYVVDDDVPAAILQAQSAAAETALDDMILANGDLRDLSPRVDVEVGHTSRLIGDLIRGRDADLVVVGSHRGRGLGELVGAPTLVRILRAADCPVLVAVGRPEAAYQNVVAGCDFSDAGRAALALAHELAPGADLHLVHAWQVPFEGVPYTYGSGALTAAAQTNLQEKLDAEAVDWPDGRVTREVLAGGPASVMLRHAKEKDCDLIAVGRHARSGVARMFLGDTAEGIALYAPCDVLVAAPD